LKKKEGKSIFLQYNIKMSNVMRRKEKFSVS